MDQGANRQARKKALFAGIGALVVLIALISWAFVASTRQTERNQAAATAARSDSEKAYENILRDSLNVYHSRYSKYPSDYQKLLDDISGSKDIYGVNDEGMNELKGIDNHLMNFVYSKMGDDDYALTYSDANSGETITVTNE
jgi:hypothetical protein